MHANEAVKITRKAFGKKIGEFDHKTWENIDTIVLPILKDIEIAAKQRLWHTYAYYEVEEKEDVYYTIAVRLRQLGYQTIQKRGYYMGYLKISWDDRPWYKRWFNVN